MPSERLPVRRHRDLPRALVRGRAEVRARLPGRRETDEARLRAAAVQRRHDVCPAVSVTRLNPEVEAVAGRWDSHLLDLRAAVSSHRPSRSGGSERRSSGPNGACRSRCARVHPERPRPGSRRQNTSKRARATARRSAANRSLTFIRSTRHRHPLYSPRASNLHPRAERLHARGNLGNEGVFRRAHQHFEGGATLDVLSQELQGSARSLGGHRRRGHRTSRRQRRRERHGHRRRRNSGRARRHAEHPQHEPAARLRGPRDRPLESLGHRPERGEGRVRPQCGTGYTPSQARRLRRQRRLHGHLTNYNASCAAPTARRRSPSRSPPPPPITSPPTAQLTRPPGSSLINTVTLPIDLNPGALATDAFVGFNVAANPDGSLPGTPTQLFPDSTTRTVGVRLDKGPGTYVVAAHAKGFTGELTRSHSARGPRRRPSAHSGRSTSSRSSGRTRAGRATGSTRRSWRRARRAR